MTDPNDSDSSEEGVYEPLPPPPPPPAPAEEPSGTPSSRSANKVYKSGPLFLSSKGIGWTSWKKRWFILTRTSLVFFRSDPNAVPPRGSEMNLTLGGIDLNSSGSVVVKEDKKLITMVFPEGRDGRGFTLKADTLEDLHAWKAALEEALADAPSAGPVVGQSDIFKNDQTDAADAPTDQPKDKPIDSFVLGRPILLALEDIDGTPSFLEKALTFVEEQGVEVEGILRQAADVEDVKNRIHAYEHGKTEFSSDEDAHVVADCVKYVLRELPSSPVPASCCNALLEACRTERGRRTSAIRDALCETFPEPNRRLLQRILMMMQTVAARKAKNRMSISAVAACMAPLLLRPLLAGECELEENVDVGGEDSFQLLQAAAAANHAQSIVIILLEDYDNLFGEGTMEPDLYTESEESGSGSEDLTEGYESSDGYYVEDGTEASDADIDDDYEHTPSGASSEAGGTEDNDKGSGSSHDGSRSEKGSGSSHRGSGSEQGSGSSHRGSRSEQANDKPDQQLSSNPAEELALQHGSKEGSEHEKNQSNDDPKSRANDSSVPVMIDPAETSTSQKSSASNVTAQRPPTVWGRTSARKNLSAESIDLPYEEESEIQKLEATKSELQTRLEEETKGNRKLQDGLETRKNALHERRLALEKDVASLKEQIQKERELRTVLEAGLKVPEGLSASSSIDEKAKAQLEEISQTEADVIHLKQKTDDLGTQLNQHRERNSKLRHDSTFQPQLTQNHHRKLKHKQKDVKSTAPTNMPEKSKNSQLDTNLDHAESNKDKKPEVSSLTRKHSPQNMMSDPSSTQFLATTTSKEAGTKRPSPINPKNGSVKGEGSFPSPSALSKLTTRLNFLKEKRPQNANEGQNADKGKNAGQPIQGGKGSESKSSTQSTEFQESQGKSPDKSKVDSKQAPQNLDDQSVPTSDRGGRPEGSRNLDRRKS